MITTIGGLPKMPPISVIMLTLIQCDGDTFASEENLVLLLLGCRHTAVEFVTFTFAPRPPTHPKKNRAHVNFDQQV